MKRLFTLLTTLLLILLPSVTACAELLSTDDEYEVFRKTAAQDYPDWAVTEISSYARANELCFCVELLRIHEHTLYGKTLEAAFGSGQALKEAISGNTIAWSSVYDSAPVPMLPGTASKAEEILSANGSAASEHYLSSTGFLSKNAELLSGSAQFLCGENEELQSLTVCDRHLFGIVENSDGMRSIRISAWDGETYPDPISSPVASTALRINSVHTGDDWLEIFTDEYECIFLPTGSNWQLADYASLMYGYDRYSLGENALIDLTVNDFGNRDNDTYHYGKPTFPVMLTEINFDAMPDLEQAVQRMDAAGFACVAVDGANMYTAPDAEVSASCYARLPGKVLRQQKGWTQLQIGTDASGTVGWFHTGDLAFGSDIENVVCTFPAYDYHGFMETNCADVIGKQLHSTPDQCWLIGKTPDGSWLGLINEETVTVIPADVIGETWPTDHGWVDWE